MPIRVLVVENEQSIADTLVQILRAHQYDTSVAYSGEDSLSLLNSFRPDVLISDMLMPGISGMEVARTAWRSLPYCKVLLISGDGELLRLVGDFYAHRSSIKVLKKPVDPCKILDFLAGCGPLLSADE